MNMSRSFRFGDSDGSLVSYFAGKHSKERMDMVREAIIEVRGDWHKLFNELAERAQRRIFPKGLGELGDHYSIERAKRAFRERRDWWERLEENRKSRVDADLVWLYTSDSGYKGMFGEINKIFRTEGPDFQDVRIATFLIELLNIDLYNHISTNPEAKNFEGIVYRGMAISQENYAKFVELAHRPAGNRAFSIPLAINSSSTDIRQALEFIKQGLEKDPSFVPVLHKIHVAGLSEERAGVYGKRSIWSSLCAVPIARLSAIPSEAEVLLRGPFFELMHESPNPTIEVCGRTVKEFEMLMLNSNRDHYTTSQTGTTDPARKLFNSLVSAEKFERCVRLSEAAGRDDDVAAYLKKSQEAETALDGIRGST